MTKKHNENKVLLIIIIVPILAYLSWLFYLKINTEIIFDIVDQAVESKAIEKIEVSSIHSYDIKFTIKDKDEINKILDTMKNMQVVNTKYKRAYKGKRLYDNLTFCSGNTKITIDNYTYPNIHISTLNGKSSSLRKNPFFQVIDFKEKDIENLENVLKKYN